MQRAVTTFLRSPILMRSLFSRFATKAENVNYKDIQKIIQSGSKCIMVDVREPNEVAEDGKIPLTIHLPLAQVTDFDEQIPCNKSDSIIVHCESGMRATQAARKLETMGYKKVYVFPGGVPEWNANQ